MSARRATCRSRGLRSTADLSDRADRGPHRLVPHTAYDTPAGHRLDDDQPSPAEPTQPGPANRQWCLRQPVIDLHTHLNGSAMNVDADCIRSTAMIMSVGDEFGDDQFGVDAHALIGTMQLVAQPTPDNAEAGRVAPVQGQKRRVEFRHRTSRREDTAADQIRDAAARPRVPHHPRVQTIGNRVLRRRAGTPGRAAPTGRSIHHSCRRSPGDHPVSR